MYYFCNYKKNFLNSDIFDTLKNSELNHFASYIERKRILADLIKTCIYIGLIKTCIYISKHTASGL